MRTDNGIEKAKPFQHPALSVDQQTAPPLPHSPGASGQYFTHSGGSGGKGSEGPESKVKWPFGFPEPSPGTKWALTLCRGLRPPSS